VLTGSVRDREGERKRRDSVRVQVQDKSIGVLKEVSGISIVVLVLDKRAVSFGKPGDDADRMELETV
jgi:hypothetical protein